MAGGGVTTINADMRVGALTETITATGESPVVDTQTSTRRQMVLSSAVGPGHSRVARLRQPAGDRPGHSGNRARRQLQRLDELLHGARRARQRRYRPDRRHERRIGVQRRWRRRLRLSDWRIVRDPGHDLGRARRSRSRRPGIQPDPEDGRETPSAGPASSASPASGHRGTTSTTS